MIPVSIIKTYERISGVSLIYINEFFMYPLNTISLSLNQRNGAKMVILLQSSRALANLTVGELAVHGRRGFEKTEIGA